MLERTDYERARATFRWSIPARYNMAVHACDAWAAREPHRPALFTVGATGLTALSYLDIARASNRLARGLAAHGVAAGDRVAILAPQSPEVLIAHLALYKLNAIAVPLASVFGGEAIHYRLEDSGAKGLIADAAGLAKVVDGPDTLVLRVCIDGAAPGVEGFHRLMEGRDDAPLPITSGPDDPALMIYTSGTTGRPKGALHGHRVLLPHVTGQTYTHGFPGEAGDRMWTPSDWAWAGGLLNTVLPSLVHGVPVVVQPPGKFDPEAAFALLARAQIRNVFIPPTALKMMRAVPRPRARFGFDLRSVGSAGEALGAETFAWGREALGVPVNEFYGQTECNYVIGSCAQMGVARAGATGRPIPGHDVAILRPDGAWCEPGEMGQIAVRAPDPVMFLGYWNRPDATAEKFRGGYMLTGDMAEMDADGYVFFQGRDDDIITSAGYRIGPTEIEDVILRHPAVALAAVVGVPDPVRTEIVKAFLVLKDGHAPGKALEAEIQQLVRDALAGYEYPRAFAYLDALPMTSTGKIIRRELRAMA
ncbi:MAG: AMP-binding protein [Pseudomonadota bacterium]